jgi:PAS domain S-box-containing protein
LSIEVDAGAKQGPTGSVSDAGYRALVQQAAEAVFLYDAASRRVLDGNGALLSLLGYTADELRALSVADVAGGTHALATLSGGEAGRRVWRRRDGRLVDVDVTVGIVRHGGRDIHFAIGRAADRERALAPRDAKTARAALGRRGRGADAAYAQLSRRESQVLKLLAHGFSNRQIAIRLKLSVKTVETFRARLYRKLGLRGRPALVRHAIRTGLLALEEPAADD